MRSELIVPTVVLTCLIAGCNREMQQATAPAHEKVVAVAKTTGSGAAKQAKPNAKTTEPVRVQVPLGEGDTKDWGYLPFKITKVYEQQTFTKTPTYHAKGGKWTFFDCQTSSGTGATFTIGVCARGEGKKEISWGKAVLIVADREQGDRFVKFFARAFHAKLPRPHSSSAPLEPLVADTAILGENLKRNPGGGFEGSGEGWTATKWFPQTAGLEAEVFFNYNIQSGEGEFSEKDPDYRQDLIAIFAIALRDGPRPERTPQSDPNLTTVGPHIEEVCCLLPRRPGFYSFSPGGKHVVFQDKSAVYAVDLFQPDKPRELARFDNGLWSLRVLDEDLRLLVLEALSKSDGNMSSGDPMRLWWVEAGGQGRQLLLGPDKDINLGDPPVSPDQRFIAIEQLKARVEKKEKCRVVSFLDRRTRQVNVVEIPDQWLSAVGWRLVDGELRAVLMTNRWKSKPDEKQQVYLADPTTGKYTIEPNLSVPDNEARPVSPDGKHRAEIEDKQRLVVVELATNKRRVFSFHEDDIPFVAEGCVTWASPSYLQFRPGRLALIGINEMKMSYPTQRPAPGASASYTFSPDFRWVLCQKYEGEKSGLYLGRVIVDSEGIQHK